MHVAVWVYVFEHTEPKGPAVLYICQLIVAGREEGMTITNCLVVPVVFGAIAVANVVVPPLLA